MTVAFDDKNNTVTISGPFDPKKLCKKLCCKAGNVIKDIQIKEQKEEKEKEKPKVAKPSEQVEGPKKDKPKETKPAESANMAKEKPKETKPPQLKTDEPMKEKPKEDKPKLLEPNPPAPEPAKAEPVYVAQEPELGYQPVWPGPGCGCGCRPWYEGYYGDYKCPMCGRGYGWVPAGPPPVVYAAPYGGYKTCHFICEEEPQSSCSVM